MEFRGSRAKDVCKACNLFYAAKSQISQRDCKVVFHYMLDKFHDLSAYRFYIRGRPYIT